MTNNLDIHCMHYALRLAQRGLGRTAPNPSVGCVIVQDNRVVGVGRTADGGRPHAEVAALKMAGEKARGADVYVTLEPCSHFGKTSPCAQALIEASVRRVVVACLDIDPRVSGRGIEMLKKAGVEVIQSVCEDDARALNSGFFMNIAQGRPHITLKTAISLDGKVALANGDSQWITGALARQKAHQIRGQHDAILCGIGTVLSDDPSLTTRLKGVIHKPIRIILDRNLRIPENSKLVQTAKNDPLWVFHDTDCEAKMDQLEGYGVQLFKHDTSDLTSLMKIISQKGVTRLLVEGGAQIHSSFIREELWDDLLMFQAGKILGKDAISCFDGFSLEKLSLSPVAEYCGSITLGNDGLYHYQNKIKVKH